MAPLKLKGPNAGCVGNPTQPAKLELKVPLESPTEPQHEANKGVGAPMLAWLGDVKVKPRKLPSLLFNDGGCSIVIKRDVSWTFSLGASLIV